MMRIPMHHKSNDRMSNDRVSNDRVIYLDVMHVHIISMDDKEKITILQNRVSDLETQLEVTQEHLKKYTAPNARKVYYERHKEVERQRAREYKERTGYKYKPTPEQKQMYYENLKIKRKQKREEVAKLNGNV